MKGRGRPLSSHAVMVKLIAHTTTQPGLTITAVLDTGPSPLGSKVTEQERDQVHVKQAQCHGEWNYPLMPTKAAQ
jgi:hypothetical protein